MKEEIRTRLQKIAPRMKEIRREIHRHPELAFEEKKTADLIASTLTELDIPHETGIAGTGVVGILGDGDAPVIGIRADMDALPMQEEADHDYCSRVEGRMHACGHDGHVAIALGTAMLAVKMADYLPGTIKFIFQPAEEGPGGAEPMIEAGVLEDPTVDYMLALHIWSAAESGKIGVKKGSSFAAIDEFDLDVLGESAHGASPHQGRDAILAAGEIIQNLQSIVSRSVDPIDSAVITVGRIEGGDRRNIIAGKARLEATVRSLDETMRDKLERRIREVISGICQAHGVDYDLDYRRLYPPLNNNEEVTEVVRVEAEKIVGGENVIRVSSPTMGGEDFAYFLRERPGTMFWLGGRSEEKNITAPHHNPRFDFDEDIMTTGAELLFRSARELMLKNS